MKSAPAARAAHLRILCCALALSTAGCAHAVRAGLGLAGVESSDAGLTSPAAPLGQVAATQRGEVVLSGYQHAPTLDWATLGLGQPFFMARSLFDVSKPEGSCQLVSRGLGQVLPVPYGVPTTQLEDYGYVQVGLLGNAGALASLLEGDGRSLGLQALATSSRLGTQGDRCYELFAYVSLGKANSAVMVLR